MSKSQPDFKEHLYELTRKLRHSNYRRKRRVQFRPSSFPICSRLVALHRLRQMMYGDRVFEMAPFTAETYFAAGHMFHEVYQNWLGKIGAIYGIWKCPHKDVFWDSPTVERRIHCGYQTEQWGSSWCPRCRANDRATMLAFEEYNLQPAASEIGLYSAHTDGCMYLGDGTHGYPIPPRADVTPDTILELKTTSQADFKARTEPKSYGHIEQASTYAELLRKLKGWDIKHIVYGYINRNHPWQVKFFRHEPLPESILRQNAWRYHLGRHYPDGINRLPEGNCGTIEDAEGFRWYGLKWLGCAERHTCFGPDGNGGLAAGERTWVDDALVKISEPRTKSD